ncbi:MAG: hypothetical protein AB1393_07295 [Candidatus Edwardsbacteria bacterium]
MPSDDYQIRSIVRRILTHRWIDTQKVDFGCTNGVVYIRGIIRSESQAKLMEGTQIKSDIKLVRHIEDDIRRLPGVRDVVFDLLDLKKTGGGWVSRER